MKKELKDDIIRLRLTAEAKQHFSELCERVGSSPSNIYNGLGNLDTF